MCDTVILTNHERPAESVEDVLNVVDSDIVTTEVSTDMVLEEDTSVNECAVVVLTEAAERFKTVVRFEEMKKFDVFDESDESDQSVEIVENAKSVKSVKSVEGVEGVDSADSEESSQEFLLWGSSPRKSSSTRKPIKKSPLRAMSTKKTTKRSQSTKKCTKHPQIVKKSRGTKKSDK
jgi:hypothetical protein